MNNLDTDSSETTNFFPIWGVTRLNTESSELRNALNEPTRTCPSFFNARRPIWHVTPTIADDAIQDFADVDLATVTACSPYIIKVYELLSCTAPHKARLLSQLKFRKKRSISGMRKRTARTSNTAARVCVFYAAHNKDRSLHSTFIGYQDHRARRNVRFFSVEKKAASSATIL